MIMDVEKADWITVDFIMITVQVDRVIVIHADMEAEAAMAAEAQVEQYLVWY